MSRRLRVEKLRVEKITSTKKLQVVKPSSKIKLRHVQQC
jgi:hypothetical protein